MNTELEYWQTNVCVYFVSLGNTKISQLNKCFVKYNLWFFISPVCYMVIILKTSTFSKCIVGCWGVVHLGGPDP